MDRAEVIAIREKDIRLKQVGRRVVGYSGHVPEHIYYDRERIDVPIHPEHPDKVALRAKKNAAVTLASSTTTTTLPTLRGGGATASNTRYEPRAAGTSTMVDPGKSHVSFSPTQSMGPNRQMAEGTDDILAALAFPSRRRNVSPQKELAPLSPPYVEPPRQPVEKLTPFPRYPIMRGPSLMTPSGLTNFLTN